MMKWIVRGGPAVPEWCGERRKEKERVRGIREIGMIKWMGRGKPAADD